MWERGKKAGFRLSEGQLGGKKEGRMTENGWLARDGGGETISRLGRRMRFFWPLFEKGKQG